MRVKRIVTTDSWWSAGHLLTALPYTPLYWLPVIGALIGVVTVPLLLVGVPILMACMRAAGGASAFADRRLARELGIALAPPSPPPAMRGLLTDRWGWRALGRSLVTAVWSTGVGILLLAAFSLGVTLVALPIAVPVLGADSATFAGLQFTTATATAGVVGGLVLIIIGLAAARPLVGLEVVLISRTQHPDERQRLRQRIRTLESTRTQMVDAAEAERLRIERDLHDGAQQRLLAVTIAISRAQRQLGRDPEKAQDLLNEARGDARTAIEELRTIARSAHPPVLTERGLPPAVTSMARRCPIPVRLDIDLVARPSRRAEAVAYYVVSELLTNAAKHSGAATVSVRIWRDGSLVRLCVSDDGAGGAAEREGGGLVGLRARLDAVDGKLAISSPPGGATIVEVELPWNA